MDVRIRLTLEEVTFGDCSRGGSGPGRTGGLRGKANWGTREEW